MPHNELFTYSILPLLTFYDCIYCPAKHPHYYPRVIMFVKLLIVLIQAQQSAIFCLLIEGK